jgi:hypothetical protein
MAAYLGVDFDEFPNEVFEAAEFRDLAFGFFLSSRGWQRLGNGLALLFVGQTRVRPMERLAWLVAVAVGLTASTAGIRDRATTEITKSGQLFDDFGAARL